MCFDKGRFSGQVFTSNTTKDLVAPLHLVCNHVYISGIMTGSTLLPFRIKYIVVIVRVIHCKIEYFGSSLGALQDPTTA